MNNGNSQNFNAGRYNGVNDGTAEGQRGYNLFMAEKAQRERREAEERARKARADAQRREEQRRREEQQRAEQERIRQMQRSKRNSVPPLQHRTSSTPFRSTPRFLTPLSPVPPRINLNDLVARPTPFGMPRKKLDWEIHLSFKDYLVAFLKLVVIVLFFVAIGAYGVYGLSTGDWDGTDLGSIIGW